MTNKSAAEANKVPQGFIDASLRRHIKKMKTFVSRRAIEVYQERQSTFGRGGERIACFRKGVLEMGSRSSGDQESSCGEYEIARRPSSRRNHESERLRIDRRSSKDFQLR